MKQNLQFPDGKLAVKSINEVYADSNGNVTVDHVATADAIGSTTATQVADTVNKAHTHDNKTTLDKLADAGGKLTYNGSEIGETVDESRLLPENPANGDIPCFDATATIGGGNDAHTKILLHFDADEIKDEAAGNAAPVTITKKTGTITVVEGGKWGKCAKYVTGSMTVATNLDELNANNWVVSGWFNPDENNHGVSYPTWLSMDDSSTNGFGFDSTGRYGESDGPLFYMDTPPASGTWHWLAIVKYSGGLRFYLNGAFLNEISAQQRANFCSTLAIGGFAGTHAAGSTERTFSGLVDEVRLQYIPEDEISKWTGTSIAVPTEPYTVKQIVGEWNTINKTSLVNSINGITPDDTGNVTLDLLTEEQLSKLNSIVLANDFTFTQSDIVSNMITKNATTLGVPAGSMVQVLSNTGIVMTERAGILVYWSGNNLIIDFTGYFNTTQTTLTGTWTVKFAGNFVGKSQSVPGGASSWDEISGKPSAFPPSAHNHAITDVTGLEDALQNAGSVKSVNGQTPDSSGAVTIPAATVSAAGMMAAADKAKLDSLNITESKDQPGYFKLPGGTIVQYGKKTMVTHDEESCFIMFPVAFPTMFLSGTATAISGTLDATGVVVSLSQVSATSMTMVVKNHPATSSQDMGNYIEIYWVAIGY